MKNLDSLVKPENDRRKPCSLLKGYHKLKKQRHSRLSGILTGNKERFRTSRNDKKESLNLGIR